MHHTRGIKFPRYRLRNPPRHQQVSLCHATCNRPIDQYFQSSRILRMSILLVVARYRVNSVHPQRFPLIEDNTMLGLKYVPCITWLLPVRSGC